MAFTVQQLLTPMSAAQIRATCVGVLQGLGLQPQNWAQGGIASSTLTAGCNILAGLSTQLSNAIAQQWNPTASGGGLQLLTQYVFGVTPPQATFASGQVTFSNEGGGAWSYGVGEVTVVSTVANANGVYPTYTNAQALSLPPGTPSSPSTATVDVTCSFVGTAGNSNPGFVSSIVSPQMLGVSCTNAAAILGSDGLTDPALRALNTASLGVRGNAFGPRLAYAYAIQTATNVLSGLPVNVNRWSISLASHTGEVTIVVASPAGPVITTDLEGISLNIDALCRPNDVTVLPGLPGYPSAPQSAAVVDYDPSIVITVLLTPQSSVPSGGLALYAFDIIPPTPESIQTAVVDALVAWFESPANQIGGSVASDDSHAVFEGVFESGVSGIIGAAVANLPNAVLISAKFSPSGDLALAYGEVAAWAGTVTVNVQYAQ